LLAVRFLMAEFNNIIISSSSIIIIIIAIIIKELLEIVCKSGNILRCI